MGDTKVQPKQASVTSTKKPTTPAPAPVKQKVAAAPTPAPPAAPVKKTEPILGGIPSTKSGAPQSAKPAASKTPARPETVKAPEKKAPVIPGSGYDIYHNYPDKRAALDREHSLWGKLPPGPIGSSIWGDQYAIPPTPHMHNFTGNAPSIQLGFNSDGIQNKDFNQADPNFTRQLQWSRNPNTRELGREYGKLDALRAELEEIKSFKPKGPLQVQP